MPGQLRRILKKWFWNTYDYLGTLMLINILWVLCALPVITLPVAMAGLFRVTAGIAGYRETGFRDFFSGMRHDVWPMLRLCGVYAAAWGLLGVNILFYINLMASWPWTGAVLSGLMGWIAVFTALTGIYSFPLLMQTDAPVRRVLRDSMLLVLDNLRTSVGLFLMGTGVLAVSAFTGAGLVFGGVSVTGVLWSTGLREVRKRYDDASSDETEDRTPDAEEPRTWRDLFRPWEYPR
jgi:uncharacterized membrane protein YesL